MFLLTIIGLAIIVILFIIVRKFPALAILDVDNLPGEKESKFKEQIIKSRVERDLTVVAGGFSRVWLFVVKQLGGVLKTQHDKLKRIKANYQGAVKMSKEDKQQQIKKLLEVSPGALRQEDESETEARLLQAINLDQTNLPAFFRLGKLYESQHKWTEARETLKYALKLARKKPETETSDSPEVTPQEIYFWLAGIEREADNLEAALDNIREALELEPASPRYLDLILDLSIIKKDQELAVSYWNKLADVNPENNKLEDWRQKIEKLSE